GGQVGQRGDVGGVQQRDRRAVVARFLDERARLGEVRLEQPVHAFRRLEGRTAHEERLAHLVVLRVADRRLEKILLVERVPERLADLDVVERRMEDVEAERVFKPQRVCGHELDVRVFLEYRQQIVRRRLDEVDLAG